MGYCGCSKYHSKYVDWVLKLQKYRRLEQHILGLFCMMEDDFLQHDF